MKLEYLNIVGFQGIKQLEIDNPNPVVVISGPNACGKSSVRDAIQFVMSGESGRCKLKKNYGNLLVNDETKKKDSVVTLRLGNVDFQRKVATGVHMTDDEPDMPIIMPFLIGTQKLAECDDKQVQRVCVAATGIKMTHEQIKDRLLLLAADPPCVEVIMPFLRGGFAAGLKEARSRCTGARGEWKGITGEVYGKEKAKNWKPEPIDVEAETKLINSEVKNLEGQRDTLIKKRDSLPHAVKNTSGSTPGYVDIGPCPACNVELTKVVGDRAMFVKGQEPRVKGPQEPVKQPVETYESVDRLVASAEQAIGRERGRVDALKREVELQDEKAHRALLAHTQFTHWDNIANLLSPSGLPAELLKEALGPINMRLTATHQLTGWDVQINSDLEVEFGGRPYGMCSESEQWRCDASISEALAHVSGVKMWAIDRMDILAPKDRGTFIKWVSKVKEQHDTVLVMATLKAEPKMPYGFTSIWLGEES